MKWVGEKDRRPRRPTAWTSFVPTLRRTGRTFVGGVPGVTPEGGHEMAVVEEGSPYDSADPACKCGCPIWDHLGGDDGACVCGCPEYRAGPVGLASAEGDQAVA